MSKVTIPVENVTSLNFVVRTDVPYGLFFDRIFQADNLLNLPDYSQGDMSRNQIIEALKNATAFMQPLRALSIMMSVVSLEDYIRQFGYGLVAIQNLDTYIEDVCVLKRLIYKDNGGNKKFSPTDFVKLNMLYKKVLNIEPIVLCDRLDDLIKIRNIVAHNAAFISKQDAINLKYYDVLPGQIFNPKLSFAKESNLFVYETGRDFTRTVRIEVFNQVIKKLDQTWVSNTPKIIIDLIVFFGYFEKIVASDEIPEGQNAHEYLIKLCVDELALGNNA